MRAGQLTQLTRDHTGTHENGASYLINAVGLYQNVELDYFTVEVQPGDVFLLSTDGLHQFLPIQALKQAAAMDSLSDAGKLLVNKAMQSGSVDNISLIFARVNAI